MTEKTKGTRLKPYNYYGRLQVVEDEGKFFVTLENYDKARSWEVSPELAQMLIDELKEDDL